MGRITWWSYSIDVIKLTFEFLVTGVVEAADLGRCRTIGIIPDVITEGAKAIETILDFDRLAMVRDRIVVIGPSIRTGDIGRRIFKHLSTNEHYCYFEFTLSY